MILRFHTFARFAQAAHILIVLKGAAGIVTAVAVAYEAFDLLPAFSVVGTVAGVGTAVVAASAAQWVIAVEGLGGAARRVMMAVVVWCVLLGVARVQEGDTETFNAPLQLITDLGMIAWCALLGLIVRKVGAPDARLLRWSGFVWLALHAAVQLIPLAGLASLGSGPLMLITMGAGLLPFVSSVLDTTRIQRAARLSEPLVPAQGEVAVGQSDDPWRPGA